MSRSYGRLLTPDPPAPPPDRRKAEPGGTSSGNEEGRHSRDGSGSPGSGPAQTPRDNRGRSSWGSGHRPRAPDRTRFGAKGGRVERRRELGTYICWSELAVAADSTTGSWVGSPSPWRRCSPTSPGSIDRNGWPTSAGSRCLHDRVGGPAGAGTVSAVDPSDSFVSAGRERHLGVDVRKASAEQLPFDDATFDAALAQLVVHFMSDPVAGLQEMARITKAGGVVADAGWDHEQGASACFGKPLKRSIRRHRARPSGPERVRGPRPPLPRSRE